MSGKTKKKIRWKEFLPYYLLALPGVIYMICNNYLPMFGVIIAFKNLNFRKGILGSDWCGLDNFKFLFASKDAFTITRNTILYNVVFIVLTTVLAIAIAILVNEIQSRFASRLYQSLILLPYLMSWVIVSYLVYAFLSAETGLVNNAILEKLGLKGISWYNSPQYWPFILTFVSLWKSLGYAMIIYFSSIVGISQDYYEAATLDGASKWQQIKCITLPLLKPTVITMFVLQTGRIFYSDFGLFYQIPMNSGLLYSTTQTIDTYVYRALLELNDIGRSTAGGFLQSILGFICVFTANAVVSKVDKDSSLF